MKTEPIHRTSMWKFKLSAATMTLIPAAVGINYVAKALAEGLKLPVWLGSLGTFLTSMLAGPVAGAISGFINNVIYGLTLSPISTVYLGSLLSFWNSFRSSGCIEALQAKLQIFASLTSSTRSMLP